MYKYSFLFIIILLISIRSFSQTQSGFNYKPGKYWFPDAKFGVFVHYTLNCVPLKKEFGKLEFKKKARARAKKFTAKDYNPYKWAQKFKSWGAKYVVLTTKHHIGFSLFDTKGTDFSAKNSSPANKDLLYDYVKAIKEAGMKVGFYYSLPDWYNPDYASLMPPDSTYNPNNKEDVLSYAPTNDTARWNNFTDQIFHEVRHLCTAYGKIDLMWFDGDWERSPEQWNSIELAAMVKRLQPGIVINNRLRHRDLGDYGTPEQVVPLKKRKDWWELCMSPGDNWSGDAANKNLKPARHLIRIFTDVLGKGGNFLLNVSPGQHGALPEIQTDRMAKVGNWIKKHKEAVFNTDYALPNGLFNGSVTRKGSTLYLIFYNKPNKEIVLKGTNSKVEKVTHLKSGDHLNYYYSGGFKSWGEKGWLYIKVPEKYIEKYATVVKVEFENNEVKFNTPSGEILKYKD